MPNGFAWGSKRCPFTEHAIKIKASRLQRRPPKETWNPKRKPMPPRKGAIWNAFCVWWVQQDILDEKRRADAWRGFYAACTFTDYGLSRFPS